MNAGLPDSGVDFRVKQQEFAAYIRDPARQPVPSDVKPERMAMYRELFFNNVESFLSSNFPVLRSLLSDEDWLALAQDFFAGHVCSTPYFAQIPEEFLDYLQNERNNANDLPFMFELAHYEWAEMAVLIAQDETPSKIAASADLLQTRLALSPLAWPLAYRYPVQRLAPAFMPEQPPEQPTFLIIYRDCNDEMNFLSLTPMTYRLLVAMQEWPNQPGAYYLQQLAAAVLEPATMVEQGRHILQDLAERIIIYTP